MTKLKLVNGTIIDASTVEFTNGILKITTSDYTVEELAELFSNKANTSRIVLTTASGIESGYKTGFTSFAGITYDPDGTKTIELFQPVNVTEARLSNVEGLANSLSATLTDVSAAMIE